MMRHHGNKHRHFQPNAAVWFVDQIVHDIDTAVTQDLDGYPISNLLIKMVSTTSWQLNLHKLIQNLTFLAEHFGLRGFLQG